jgi:MarR family transcriptional regulator for hemolysin
MTASPARCAREVLDTVPLIMRTLRAEMRSHRTPDLTVPQFRTLRFINRYPGVSLSDAAEHIGLTLPSMSKIVDGLVTRQLVVRQPHPEDRRRLTLSLTTSGRAMSQAALEATQACLAEALQRLSDAQRAAVIDAMRTLRPLFT